MGQGVHTVLRQIACEELGARRPSASASSSTPSASSTPADDGLAVHGAGRTGRGRRVRASCATMDGRDATRRPRRPGVRGEIVEDWTTKLGAAVEEPVTHFALRLGHAGRHPRRRGPHREGRRGPRCRAGHQPDTRSKARSRAAVHMGLGHALSEEFVARGRRPGDRDAEVARHHPRGGYAGRRVHPRRGAQPEGPYGAKGVGETALVPTASAVAGRAPRLRRGLAHEPPDARHARRRARPCPGFGTWRAIGGAGGRMSLLVSGGTVVTSLDPPVVEHADVLVDDGRIVVDGRPWRAADRRAHRRHRMPRHPRQRLRPYAPLLRARAGHALSARPAVRLRPDPPAGVVASRPGPRRGGRPRLGARRRPRGAPRRHDDAHRPPCLPERDRRLARCRR